MNSTYYLKQCKTFLSNAIIAFLLCGISITAFAQNTKDTTKIDRNDSIIQVRNNFINYWTTTCFPGSNWDSTVFNTLGVSYSTFTSKEPIVNINMSKLYGAEAVAAKYLPGVIVSGSTYPTMHKAKAGQLFYKIVSRGKNIGSPSPYYLSDSMFKAVLIHPCLLEQELGLPIGSMSVQYDVFTIRSLVNDNLYFNSKIAATDQYKKSDSTIIYHTVGGGIQSLIINNQDAGKWQKSTLPILTILPFCKPE